MPDGQHARVGVVELDAQRAALADRNGEVEPAVLDAQLVEMTQRLPGEVADLGIVALALELGDHHDGDHDVVLGEAEERPRIAQQHRGVEHVRAQILTTARRPRRRPDGAAAVVLVWSQPTPAPGGSPGSHESTRGHESRSEKADPTGHFAR